MRRFFAALVLLLGAAAPVARGAGSGNDFRPLTPCRVLDTRLPAGPLGAPTLQPGVSRSFGLTGVCGIPAGAVAVSVNVTVTNTSALGQLVIYDGDLSTPGTSNLSFGAHQTRASESILGLAADGSINALVVGGSADFILDVSGYFAPDATPPITVTLDAVPDQTIPTNTTLSLRLLGHSSSAADALTYSLVSGPGGATVSPLGVFSFSPNPSQLGPASVTAKVQDGSSHSAQRTFQIMVMDHDHPPFFGPLPDDVAHVGQGYTKTLTATDPDAGDTLTFSLVSGPSGMALTGATLSWTPTAAQIGSWPVHVKVTDHAGLSASGQFNVAVQFLVATDDFYNVTLGQILTVNAPGVLANDLDPLSGPLTAAKLTNPDKGTLNSFNANGSFTFQAPPILPGPAFVPVVKYHVDVLNYFLDAPLVADLDGDGKPEIIIHSGNGAGQFGFQALKGVDGSVLWTTPTLPPPNADCTVGLLTAGATFHGAIGDIDDSGQVSIVFPTTCGRDGGIGTVVARYAALNGKDGSFKWLSPPIGRTLNSSGQPDNLAFGTVATIARLRVGESPSVLIGRDVYYFTFAGKHECAQAVPGWPNPGPACRAVFVLDGKDGSVRQSMAAPYPGIYGPEQTLYSNGWINAVAADLDGDGSMEIIFGSAVFNSDGSVRSNNNDPSTRYTTAWVGLGNFDDTPDIEIVRLEDVLFGGQMRLAVYKSDGRLLWAVPTSPIGGIPVVADVDGSGHPSVVFLMDSSVCAVDYKGNYKWCHDAGTTGGYPNIPQLGSRMQVYDLDGDGIPEVVASVNPETLLFLDGKTGNVKFTYDMGAVNGGVSYPRYGDQLGGPVVADVDGSGHASIVTVWNGTYGTARLDVVKSSNDDWRPARKIFNQAAYQFGNVNDDGTIPKTFVNNFAAQATNVFGTQAQVLTPVDPRLKSQTSFTYAASDGALTSAPGTVTITINPTNRPPVFVSKPPTRYLPGAFSYASQAVDPDPGDTVTYSIKAVQGGDAGASCTIGAASGILSCTLNTGEGDLVLAATDSFGAAGYQTLRLLPSAGPGTVPDVVGQQQAAAGTALVAAGFVVGNVTKLDNVAPAGQVVQQTPGGGTSAPLGSSVDLAISNGPSVPAPPGPPPGLGNIKRIVVTPASTVHLTGENAPYTATSVNNDGTGADITAFVTWASSSTAIATVSAAGVAHAAGAGTATITATVGGLTGQASISVAARTNADNTPPVAILTQPAGGGTVTGLTQVLGTATDANFLRYELALEASGDTVFTQFGLGTSPVANGVLGTLDPTLLLNGAYTLRLSVFDRNGNTTTADAAFVVDGNQKVGNFTLSYTDMTVPLSGIPIQITRTYDSRDKHAGDFGVGWSLGLKALRVSTSAVLGSAWQVVQQGSVFALTPGTDHFVSVTLANGKVETFDLKISPTVSPFVPFTTLFATFVPRLGTLGTLQSLENVNLLILDPQPGPVTLVDDTSLTTFHPDRFLYTQLDGTQYVVTRTKGVESVKDTNGNQITISAGGISHSSGAAIAFARDGIGRITGITDPMGHSRSYAYGPTGDLASATDRGGNTTKYFYDAQHGLVRIEDPLGRPVSRADYDDQGRLLSLTDANGHAVTFQHDLPGRQEQVEDALGRITVSQYDDRGNVVSVTDPLGNTTTSTYDAQNNLLTQADPLGAVRSFAYDGQNFVVSATDALGHTTFFTRDAAGRELTRTDARGKTIATQYDANGKVVGTTNALGHTTASAYDASGNLTSYTDAAGATSSNQFDALGRRTQVIDPLGNSTGLQYDAGGNLLTQQSPSGAPWGLSYDANGQITGTSFGSLSRTLTRDAANVISGVTTAAGVTISVASDPAGRFTGLTDPSGAPLRQQAYDEVGNIQSTTDSLGNQTLFTYDAGNRLTATTLADGTIVSTAYDVDGRPIQTTDALGRTTSYQYDAAGRLTMQTNALGGQTQYQYDAVGNPLSVTDPAGRTTTYAYDDANQLVLTTYADGTTESRAYDAEGRILHSTDGAGHVTSWTYDSMGRLVTVVDPLGKTTTYAYTGAGPRSSVTDANGHTTAFAYDDHGRLTGTTHPLGDAEAATYDGAGHVLSQSNGAGETVQYQYDTGGRLASVTRPDGTTFVYTYTADGLVGSVRDARGLSVHAYDPATRRLTRVTEPDGRYVRYQYDAAGNRTVVAHGDVNGELATTYLYDALNRLVKITDPSAGVTTQVFDAASNLTSVTRPNGVTTTTTYDARNRPLVIVSRDSANTLLQQHSYTLDALGNRTRVDAFDGSHVDYQYDALTRIVRERHFDASAVLQLDLTYGYDPAGNLVSAGPTGAPVSFTFNADDELVSGGGVTYTYDLAGRRIQESFTLGGPTLFRNYTWDAEDRLTSFQDTAGATTTYVYDDAGVRQSKGGATGPVTFLTDRASATGFSQILRETSLSGTNTFVWGNRLFETVEAGTPRFHLFDALGSTRVLTGTSGAVTDTFDYKAYGELLSHVGGSGIRHRFAGEEFDPESGLTYLRARYYDPSTGSFLTRDPAAGDAFDPLSFHPYAYASGNPVNRRDPSGRETLLELTQSMAIQFYQTASQIVNYRREFVAAEQDVAKVMQVAGGILAVEALIEEAGDKRPVLGWFGGVLGVANNLVGNAFNSPNPTGLDVSAFFGDAGYGLKGSLSAIELAAGVALLKGATDLFTPDKAKFEIQVLPPTAEQALHGQIGGANNHGDSNGNRWCGAGENADAHAAAGGDFSVPGAPTWTVALCRNFFTDTPLPRADADGAPAISMAGVMVHEFMHITAARVIRDDAYGCGKHRFGLKNTVKENAKAALPGANLFSADAYRCWVEGVALGNQSGLTASESHLGR